MRKDMTRLLVHRGKGGKSWATRPARKKNRDDYENMPKRSAVGRGYRQKYPGEYLTPFKRFLVRRVGQPWNKVYSEIREHLRVDKAVHLHVMQHLEDMVVLRTWMQDGKLVGVGCYGQITAITWSRWCVCYVDEDGILRALPQGKS